MFRDVTRPPYKLIADPRPDVRREIRAVLEYDGCVVHEADTPETCQQMAQAESYDLIVMPGFWAELADLCQQFKAQESFPVVLVSVELFAGKEKYEDVAFVALNAGADDIFALPPHHEVLRHRVRRLLQERTDVQRHRLAESELRDGLEQLDVLIQSMPMAIGVFDQQGDIVLRNYAFNEMFGDGDLSPQLELIEDERKPPTSFDLQHAVTHVMGGDRLLDQVLRFTHPDGESSMISVSALPLLEKYAQRGVAFIAYDITQKRRAESAEREQRTLAAALRDTASSLARAVDPQTVMNLILENVGHVVPHKAANIHVIDEDKVRVAFSRGYAPALKKYLEDNNLPKDMPTLRHMLLTGESIYVADTHVDPLWRQVSGTEWVRSYVATPIRAHDQVIGFLNLDSDQPNAFSPADADHLRAFADQAAIAIENAQIYENMNRDAAELRALHRATSFLFASNVFTANDLNEVGRRIAQTVVNEFGKIDCGVILIGDQPNTLQRVARAGDYHMQAQNALFVNGDGLVPEAIRLGRIVYAPDVREHPRYISSDPRTRSELAIPLKTSKEVFGALDLQSPDVNAFDEQDQRILLAFAERAAAAIENMQLYNQIQERVRQRTAELARVKERAEAILNHSSDAILLVRPDGRIQQTNHAFNEMFVYAQDEVYNLPLEVTADAEYVESLRNTLARVVVNKRSARVEIVATRRDGTQFDADVVMSPVIEEARVSSVVCSLRDNTERKQLEVGLREALAKARDLSDLKSRFISRASHEFRTPLAMIATASDLLKTYSEKMTEVQRREKIERMQTEVRNLSLMLDDLLMISKAEEVGKADFHPIVSDLEALCRNVIEEVREGIGIHHTIALECRGNCSRILLDQKLMRRVVLNLLSNAIKYSPEGSVIRVLIDGRREVATIAVRDAGIGIPEDDQRRLFEPFHRASNVDNISGTGLGLVIVKQSVEQHGGTITVDSRLGVGSIFTITLPQGTALKQEPA